MRQYLQNKKSQYVAEIVEMLYSHFSGDHYLCAMHDYEGEGGGGVSDLNII